MSNSENIFLPNNTANTFSIFDSSASNTNANHYSNSLDYNFQQQQSEASLKETGIIEKMLVSYGFIQCCERQARLFFHFSQFLGKVDHLRVGDPVEYETSYDKRTGKPVAVNIKKIASEDMTKLSATERLTGVIATEMTNGREGRVAFENHGEFFFPPFNKEDVIDDVNLKPNDKVTFILITDDNGTYRATNVQLEAPEEKLIYIQGIISNIKASFGFIERSDTSSKIFFHSSECDEFKSLNIGDLVQFNITTRKSKELAINVTKQANANEDVSDTLHKGQVIKYNNRSNLAFGFIRCQELKKEFFFSENDFNGDFTINISDYVSFQIATDQRTKYQRAVNITFRNETFEFNSENREMGYVAFLEETHGKIICPNLGQSLIYFKHTELIDPFISLKLNDEVEFTLVMSDNRQDNMNQTKKYQAIRISILPNGTVFKDAYPSKKTFHNDDGHQHNNAQKEFNLIDLSSLNSNDIDDTQSSTDGIKINGNNGDVNNVSSKWTRELIDIFQKNELPMGMANGSIDMIDTSYSNMAPKIDGTMMNGVRKGGIIVVLKDNYGFIESIDGEMDYYFHTSSYIDEINPCILGQFVEFDTLLLNNKWKASKVICNGNIKKHEDDLSEVFLGTVVRTLQMFDTDQPEYTGEIVKLNQNETQLSNGYSHLDQETFEFSMISLKFYKDYISIGDTVRFQVATNPVSKKKRAYNVEVIRDRIKGTVLTLQRMYGFLKPDQGSCSGNVYFNAAEIRSGTTIKNGDRVDFYLIKNEKTDKYYAIDICKLDSTNSSFPAGSCTDRTLLKSFLMKTCNENGPKVIVIRQPRAPDGSKGFVANPPRT